MSLTNALLGTLMRQWPLLRLNPLVCRDSYTVNVSQMASASTQVGTSDVGSNLNATSDVSGLTLSNAAFIATVTDGYFTVNNTQITISSSDTLGSVLTSIKNAIGGSGTAVYNSSSDKIEVNGNGTTIVFGSSTDTSNFLQVAELYNNGTDTVTSSNTLGRINPSTVLNSSNFGLPSPTVVLDPDLLKLMVLVFRLMSLPTALKMSWIVSIHLPTGVICDF